MKKTLTAFDLRGAKLAWIIVVFCVVTLLITLIIPSLEILHKMHENYLPIHMLLESASIFVSLAIFVLGWSTYEKVSNSAILFLSITSLAVALLDFGHMLSFTGMPNFITPSDPNKAIYFWLASRFTDVAAMLFISFFYFYDFPFKRLAPWLMSFAFLWTGLCFVAILYYPDVLPVMFVPGQGLMLEKVLLEWVAMGLALVAAAVFLVRARRDRDIVAHWLAAASVISLGVGIYFTLYREFDDLFNFMGHVYKTISFGMVFYIVFHECVSRPYHAMKRLAHEASEAGEAKIRFLANVSHEFRTPLGVISGFSDLLLESKGLDDEARQWTETIHRNSDQLRILIDDLLDLAKAETGRISTHWSRFQVSEVVDDVVAGLTLLAQQKHLQLTVENSESAPHTITSDPQRLRQILVNLIGNAIKFTDRGLVRVIVTSSNSDGLRIEVTDSGIGIREHAVERLFKPFSQIDDSLTRRTGGTGLGLALSKKLAHLLGGELWLDKTEVGAGSTFIFTVANQRSGPESSQLSKNFQKAGVPDLHGKTILAADDSLENLNLIKLYLKDSRAEVKTVINGKEALKLCRAEAYDIVLMDVQMPEMDGYEATHLIRQDGWRAPIVAVTAHAQIGERERALREGFDDYLVKPFSKEQLWQTIRINLKLS